MVSVLYVAAAAALLTCVWGQAPKKCCMESKFQAKLTDITTINGNQFEMNDLASDYERKQQAIVSSVFDPNTKKTTFTYRNVVDFNKKKLYTIPANDTSKCYVSAYPWYSMLKCIPADAQYVNSSYLGPISSLPFDAWRFKMPNSDAIVTMAVTTTGCVPLVEGVSGGGENKLYLFTTFQAGIKNPEWFDLPASCWQ